MRKFLLFIGVLMVVVAGIAGAIDLSTGKSEPPTTPSISPPTSATPVKADVPVDLTGTWVTPDEGREKAKFVAVISSKVIDIVMISGTTKMSYWYGTFENPQADGITISSALNDDKVFLSSSKSKQFTYKNGKLSFEMGSMGVTTIVEMKRE